MTTYVYQIIPQKEGEEPEYFEIQQSMRDAPLTHHPETGRPVQRVIVGGFGLISKSEARGECCMPEGGGQQCQGPMCCCQN
jgi:predicted nucleic acid-binding Zn ribbon protein